MPHLTDLAREILRNAEIIDGAASRPQDAITLVDVDEARTALLDATHKLTLHAQSPESYMFQQMWSITDTFILRMIYTLNLPHHVPLTGSTTYAAIATQVCVPEDHLTRLFRYAITIGFFAEPTASHVAHSPPSRLLALNPDAFDAMGMILHELGPATHAFPSALSRFAASPEPHETAYNIANKTDLGMYDFLAQHPSRARRFAGAMRFFSDDAVSYIRALLSAFPWTDAAQDREDFIVVDVGGGVGSVAVTLAEHTAHMRFVVQDKEEPVEEGRGVLPRGLEGRVEFQTHDFFTPQPRAADVYFFRWIFHNWSDKYCVRILQNLIPALKSGARVMVYEHVMEPGVDMLLSKKRERYLDLFMLCAYNGHERTEEEWRALFAAADGRFAFQGVTTTLGAPPSLIQTVWRG
ncbi:S-adenosyl-L-methionine-dependent methyltransferase [Karstenula rhodostoma CBS 690.94]|uniref:S-adenosyl-L-methionine-dependent methyltransferase n=1 Tax=Karstenula rhodostoma CBS 690.94 TaxID=1392251 RepID=A0A9P4PQ09_9PLEO|nr:S-adenosyl-L-methionine-dependent methyltransferase [Karstenula rhodostoma CBS 690.94]